MKDTVMQGRIVDCYSLMGSKEGQVKIETQWFPQAKKDKSAASDEKADAIASVGSSWVALQYVLEDCVTSWFL